MENKNKYNLNLKHEAMQELLGEPPGWLVRCGISVFAVVIVILLVGSSLFMYPQIINAPITITSEQPSVWVIAKTSGKIDSIYVSNQDSVFKGQVLAVIHNTAKTEDVICLKQLLSDLSSFMKSFDIEDVKYSTEDLQVGELQEPYTQLMKVLREYEISKEMNLYDLKIETIKEEIVGQQIYLSQLQEQRILYHESYEIATRRYLCDSILYDTKALSSKDYEQSMQQKLAEKIQGNQLGLNITNAKMHIVQLRRNIDEYIAEKRQAQVSFQTTITRLYGQLNNSLLAWEQAYLLEAPVDGLVSFSKFWGKYQFINVGEQSFAVVPHSPGKVIGKCSVSTNGAGKIKQGQKVNIKLDGFPYMEFGTITGVVESISLIPLKESHQLGTEYIYSVEISFDDLITSYGDDILFNGEFTGTAEIATKEMSFLEHLIGPLKYLWSKRNAKAGL